VQSVEYPELLALGKAFFKKIGYRGVGSAEFKLDDRDGTLKLIELNPR
jgi:predicted ATP-grasp superfamily ATP-dependent carboligase